MASIARANESPELYTLTWGTVAVHIKGLTPLLQNKWTADAIRKIKNSEEGVKASGKQPRIPENEFADHQHKCGEHQWGHPAVAFKLAMERAAKPLSGMNMTDTRMAINVLGDENGLVPITSDPPIMNAVPGHPQRNVTMMVYRPEFRNWEADIIIEFDMEMITAEQVINVLARAGRSPSIGAWRVEKGGSYGKFMVTGGVEGDR